MSISEGRSFFQLLSLRLRDVSAIKRAASRYCRSTHSICAIRNSFASWWSLRREKSLLWFSVRNSKPRHTSRSDIHSTGNIPGNLHQRARRGKGAGNLIGGFIILGRPVAQIWIQVGRDERYGDDLRVRRRACAEFAPNIERPRSILGSTSIGEYA